MARKKILVPINPMEQKINDKQKIEKIFATLSQESKLMVMVYVSALSSLIISVAYLALDFANIFLYKG